MMPTLTLAQIQTHQEFRRTIVDQLAEFLVFYLFWFCFIFQIPPEVSKEINIQKQKRYLLVQFYIINVGEKN